LTSTFSYESGKRNSSYELDRYIANKMMVIFNNVQEILQKQPGNIFITDTRNELSNNISILGYYAGYIRVDTPFSSGCEIITPEVAVMTKYIDKNLINEYFHSRDSAGTDCKSDMFIISKRAMISLGGKIKNKYTKRRRYSNKRKNRATKYKKNKYSMQDIWFDISKNKNGVFNAREHWIYYHQGGGREKFLKYYRDKDMKEIREYIEENKDNEKALKDGHKKYYFNLIMYKSLLKEAGLSRKPE
jgi:hypothetical protein